MIKQCIRGLQPDKLLVIFSCFANTLLYERTSVNPDVITYFGLNSIQKTYCAFNKQYVSIQHI